MEKKKDKLTWCTSCCQWVGAVHTCYDHIECLVEDWCNGLIDKKNLYNLVKNISARTRIYSDFMGGRDE